jgi:hypothetical protein
MFEELEDGCEASCTKRAVSLSQSALDMEGNVVV